MCIHFLFGCVTAVIMSWFVLFEYMVYVYVYGMLSLFASDILLHISISPHEYIFALIAGKWDVLVVV